MKVLGGLCALGLLSACTAAPEFFIVAAGERFPCAARVIPWTSAAGFDAHLEHCRFDEGVLPRSASSDTATPKRYGVRGTKGLSEASLAAVNAGGWNLEALRERIDLFVMHYDVCHDSAQCFDVLHDQRGLSVHFLLDLDGTIYQTLDLAHRARHATIANDRSVGIEIAQLGAYADSASLSRAYRRDEAGRLWLEIPRVTEAPGFRRTGARVRPSNETLHRGQINARDLVQHDFTEAQYTSLAALIESVRAICPRIERRFPTDEEGRVLPRCLEPAEFEAFSGVLGHFHVQKDKSDPGPAFDWPKALGLNAGSR